MIVQDGKGEDLTTASGSFDQTISALITLHLYVADDGTAFSETREYEVTVSFMDGSTATAKTTVRRCPISLSPKKLKRPNCPSPKNYRRSYWELETKTP